MYRHLRSRWKRFPYKQTAILIITVLLFILLLDSVLMVTLFETIKKLQYAGAFLAGMLFVSIFTAAAAVVMLFELAQLYNPFLITLMASIGAVVGDYVLIRIYEDKLADELRDLVYKMHGRKLLRVLRRRKYRSVLLLTGLGIISSPLPDELGITLLEMSRFSKTRILVLCFFANMLGVIAVVAAGYATR
jgi:Co/Zn/Cd efflux system component